jgi:hypothetical protein
LTSSAGRRRTTHLDLIESLNDPAQVASLTWAKDGKVLNNPNRKVERALDQWPFPIVRVCPGLRRIHAPDVPAVLSMERFTTMAQVALSVVLLVL